MASVRIVDLCKVFGQGESRVQALRHINLGIEAGEFVAIIGQSGSGKSTLMNILGCLDTPSSGAYYMDGVDTAFLDADGLARLRGEKFGFIFQRYNLLNSMTAVDNVALPAVYAGMPQKARQERAQMLLAELGLPDKFRNRPNELSGGQQQRVSIARALMNGGEIILADEPTGALDSRSGEHVMHILRQLNEEGHTIIVVTHDRQVVAFADRVVELKDGTIISDDRRQNAVKRGQVTPPVRQRSLLFLKDQFQEACAMSLQAIFAHKMRSLLTMLGIIIGITSVVSMVALGQGSQAKILADINAMGTNTIDIIPGYGYGDMRSARVRTLTVEDSGVLAEQPYIASSSPVSSSNGTLTRHNVSVSARLNSVGEQYLDVRGLRVAQGRPLTRMDVVYAATVAIIDRKTQERLFPDGGEPLGKIVLFNRQPLEIVGVMEDQNSAMGASDTLNLWTPYTTVMNRITGNRFISSIAVKIRDDVVPAVAEKSLIRLLTVRHN